MTFLWAASGFFLGWIKKSKLCLVPVTYSGLTCGAARSFGCLRFSYAKVLADIWHLYTYLSLTLETPRARNYPILDLNDAE